MLLRFTLLFLIALPSCTTLSELALETDAVAKSSYLVTRTDITRASQWVLAQNTRFYLAINSDHTVANPAHSDRITQSLVHAIGENFAPASIGIKPETLQQAIISANHEAADFVVFPTILDWDDRASTWTEALDILRLETTGEMREGLGFDKLALQLLLVHAQSGKLFDVVRIEGSSGLLTLYEDTPDKVVLGALRSFFASLTAAG